MFSWLFEFLWLLFLLENENGVEVGVELSVIAGVTLLLLLLLVVWCVAMATGVDGVVLIVLDLPDVVVVVVVVGVFIGLSMETNGDMRFMGNFCGTCCCCCLFTLLVGNSASGFSLVSDMPSTRWCAMCVSFSLCATLYNLNAPLSFYVFIFVFRKKSKEISCGDGGDINYLPLGVNLSKID